MFQGEEWAASTPFPFFADYRDAGLRQAVSEGRGVITCHDVSILWNRPTETGLHAVNVTGIEYVGGYPAYVIIADTGRSGTCMVKVPFLQFLNSINKKFGSNIGGIYNDIKGQADHLKMFYCYLTNSY